MDEEKDRERKRKKERKRERKRRRKRGGLERVRDYRVCIRM